MMELGNFEGIAARATGPDPMVLASMEGIPARAAGADSPVPVMPKDDIHLMLDDDDPLALASSGGDGDFEGDEGV